MVRLLLRVYWKLLLAFLVAGALIVGIVLPRVADQVSRNIASSLSAPVAVMSELAAREAENPALRGLLADASRRFQTKVEVVERAALTLGPSLMTRIDRGEIVAEGHFLRSRVFARIGTTDRFIVLGPLNPVHPFGEGRGAAILLLLLAAVSLGAFVLVLPITRRLDRLAKTAHDFGDGELAARAEVGPADAIGGLTSAFNQMADRIEQLVASQRELLRMVSHELRTPMQRIHFGLDMVRDPRDEDEHERGVARISRELLELDALIEELLSFTRLQGETLGRGRVTVGAVLDEVVETARETAGEVAVRCQHDFEGTRTFDLNEMLVRRAVGNLVNNALRHARSRVDVAARANEGALVIEVDDDGPGVPVSERARIFEPFHRLDDAATPTNRGFGLGLAIVARIAEAHRGAASVSDSPLGGARFRLELPAA